MKVYNENAGKLTDNLNDILGKIRDERGFNVFDYIDQKAKMLNKYMSNAGLSSVVIGMSGGIDSSVVLGIANYASKIDNSPIKKIVPVTIPIKVSSATNQDESVVRSQDVCNKFGQELKIVDLSQVHNQFTELVSSSVGMEADEWAKGQSVAHLRVPVLAYVCSLLTKEGMGGVILGTNNKSEFSYLGYVGKYSDGMVDIQMISDIYKSEVYKVAAELGVPDSVMNVTPSGDMYDGREDEEVFGAPYDFVELYLELKVISGTDTDEAGALNIFGEVTPEDLEVFNKMAKNIEDLHNYNKHKYSIGNSSVHFNIYDATTPGGWNGR